MGELHKYIDPSQLPTFLKGTCKDELYDRHCAWTDYINLCHEKGNYFPDGVVQGDPWKEPSRRIKEYNEEVEKWENAIKLEREQERKMQNSQNLQNSRNSGNLQNSRNSGNFRKSENYENMVMSAPQNIYNDREIYQQNQNNNLNSNSNLNTGNIEEKPKKRKTKENNEDPNFDNVQEFQSIENDNIDEYFGDDDKPKKNNEERVSQQEKHQKNPFDNFDNKNDFGVDFGFGFEPEKNCANPFDDGQENFDQPIIDQEEEKPKKKKEKKKKH